MSRTPTSDPAASVAAALEHLARSRQQLRAAVPGAPSARQPPSPQPNAKPNGTWPPEPVDLMGRTTALRAALAQAWQHHPVVQGAELAGAVARLALQGTAERHPLALVLAAGGLGMVLAGSRPWRWAIRPALRSGWPARLALDVLAQVPLHCWVTALAANPAGTAPPTGP